MYNLVFGFFGGVVAYAHVVDNMGMQHTTGVAIGLLVAILISLFFWLYSMEYDDATREWEKWERKRR